MIKEHGLDGSNLEYHGDAGREGVEGAPEVVWVDFVDECGGDVDAVGEDVNEDAEVGEVEGDGGDVEDAADVLTIMALARDADDPLAQPHCCLLCPEESVSVLCRPPMR